jgi:hypothetical protein
MQRNGAFSSARGKIKKIFLSCPHQPDPGHVQRIAGMVSTLPRRIGIIVWCNQHRDGEILQKALADLQISSVIYEAGQVLSAQEPCILLTPAPNTSLNYPCWTRDPFLFRATHGKTIRIHNSAVVHGDESLWSEHFLKKLSFDDHTAFSIAETPLPVAGGNLLADHHFVLVGTRQFRDFTRKQVAGESGYQLPRQLGYGLDTRFIQIGNPVEPAALRHIDLFISLTGCIRADTGRYIVLVARCELPDNEKDRDLPGKVHRANQYLDEAADSLREQGFEVLRNPVPTLPLPGMQGFYLCALNNCLVEVCGQYRQVWLPNITQGKEISPVYAQLCAAEEANRAIWKSLHFKVCFLPGNFHELMRQSGALHCIANEMQRSMYKTLAVVS